jgi:phosphoribosylglycinamide formyltransferase-1
MFVSASIRPLEASFNADAMAHGEPGLPRTFLWNSKTLAVCRLLRSWKDNAPCRHGSGERYVNRHWFECELESGETARLYFERRARRGSAPALRWHLFSLDSDPSNFSQP